MMHSSVKYIYLRGILFLVGFVSIYSLHFYLLSFQLLLTRFYIPLSRHFLLKHLPLYLGFQSLEGSYDHYYHESHLGYSMHYLSSFSLHQLMNSERVGQLLYQLIFPNNQRLDFPTYSVVLFPPGADLAIYFVSSAAMSVAFFCVTSLLLHSQSIKFHSNIR